MKRSIAKRLSDMVFGRRNRGSKEIDTRPDLNRVDQVSNRALFEETPVHDIENGQKDWLCVGNDEEGTPVYLDKSRMVRQSGSAPARVWLKHVPAESARSLKQAQQYLKETGVDWKSFCYIEQLLELDLQRDRISDLSLFFFDRNDRLIEQVQFRESTDRPMGTEAVYSVIKEIVAGRDIPPDNTPEPDYELPTMDERIEIKLQEINSALEDFDTCDDSASSNACTPRPARPKPSR